jgi:hypothetical protein
VEIENQSGLANAIGLYSHIDGVPAVGGFSAAVKGAINHSGIFGISVWGDHGGGAWGVYGSSNTGIGVVGTATNPSGHAAWFDGRVHLNGDLLFEDEGDRITSRCSAAAPSTPTAWCWPTR